MRAWIFLLCLSGTAHAGRVTRPPPAVTKSPDRAAIRRVIRTDLMKIFACFERDGLTTAKVDVDFTIGATGKVLSTRTTSTGSATLQHCVASVFAKLTFAPRIGPVAVHYPVQICVAGQ